MEEENQTVIHACPLRGICADPFIKWEDAARGFYIIVLALLAVAIMPPTVWALGAAHQDFSSDPQWNRRNNRIEATPPRTVTQDFGYRSSNNAGLAAGEIGGVVDRTPLLTASYAEVLTPLTFEQPLKFSGQLSLLQASHTVGFTSSSDIFIGFFNAREQGWRPPDFLGVRLRGHNEPVPNVASLELSYGTSVWEAGGVDWGATILPDGAQHTYELDYNPAFGDGRITLSWDGAQILTLDLRALHRTHGAVFDRFGIFSNQLPGLVSGNTVEAYFDDVTVNGVFHNFAVDPAWEQSGNNTTFADPNLYGTNDFGFSQTGFAGGSLPGELGGLVWRVEDFEENLQGYYADDVGTLTLDDHLTASGKIVSEEFSVDAGVMLGWFDSGEQDWPPSNFVGVYMDSLSDTGRLFTPMYGTGAGSTKFARDPWLLLPPDGEPRDWSIEYDPNASGGDGAITLTLNESVKTLALEPGHKAEGAIMDRFGIFNMQDNNGKHSIIYLDDLSYTSSEVPTMHGDFNHDSAVDDADIDLMRLAVISMTSDAKFNVDAAGDPNVPDEIDFEFLIIDIIGSTPGDGDLNGTVNFDDFVILSNDFGKSNTNWSQGNYNLDLVTNFNDFVAISARFGQICPCASETRVPEPVTLASILVGVQMLNLPARRSRLNLLNPER